MKQNANDGVGSATAAPFRTLTTLFTQTTPRERGYSCPPGAQASAKPTGMSALLALVLFLAAATAIAAGPAPAGAAAKSEPIPRDQIGAVAGTQYQGDGLSVAATPEGARLRCLFQKLEGQVTREGLWLTSTTDDSKGERFRVVASTLGRWDGGDRTSNIQHPTPNIEHRTSIWRLRDRLPWTARPCDSFARG
jgi:hypothetical protein